MSETITVVIGFAPYEKELLSCIRTEENLAQLPENDAEVNDLIDDLFQEWVQTRYFWFAMRMMDQDMDWSGFIPAPDPQRAYDVFLSRLQGPTNRDHVYRADLFANDNPEFKNHLRQLTDLRQ